MSWRTARGGDAARLGRVGALWVGMGDPSVNNPSSAPETGGHGAHVDAVMDRASSALVETDYFGAIDGCVEALHLARRAADFERMSRIVMPLLEARRQVRQLAIDAAADRGVIAAGQAEEMPDPFEAGCYLLRPPFLGIDGTTLRAGAADARVPVFALVREPTTRAGLWPVVGVGRRVVRVRLDPPPGGEPTIEWFEAAAEALGDQAIVDADAANLDDPPAFLVDDLLERLGAAPEHEKLHQRLAQACQEAAREPLPTQRRRRPIIDDPTSF